MMYKGTPLFAIAPLATAVGIKRIGRHGRCAAFLAYSDGTCFTGETRDTWEEAQADVDFVQSLIGPCREYAQPDEA